MKNQNINILKMSKQKTLYDTLRPKVFNSLLNYFFTEIENDLKIENEYRLSTKNFEITYTLYNEDAECTIWGTAEHLGYKKLYSIYTFHPNNDIRCDHYIICILKDITKCFSCENYKIINEHENFVYNGFCSGCSYNMVNNPDTDEIICAICLEDLVDFAVYKTSCNHYFHNKCMKTIKKCPSCRNILNDDL
jgi:hypothetical protein